MIPLIKMAMEISFEEMDEISLLDLLTTETKNFTEMLSMGLDDSELDTRCYRLNLIIHEIRIRKGLTEDNSYPHLSIKRLKSPNAGT
ncbi:MAG TPA: hypothetical protein VFV08_03130 [Puia sp.]|nr:hypothetical protein [Puia sp.]